MKKIILIIGVITVVIAFVMLLKDNPSAPQEKSESVQVVASFYPLAHIAEQVGGTRVQVLNLTPVGAESHDYEPAPKDLIQLQNADLVMLNGAGFESWYKSAEDSLTFKGVILVMSEKIQFIPILEDASKEDIESEHFEDDHGDEDPHFWLDPVRMRQVVDIVRDTLIALDPAGKEEYQVNASRYSNELFDLDQVYQTGLASCQNRNIIVSHDAFQYLANQYSIEIESISGMSPEEEPSPRRMAELVEIAKNKGVRYIFFETLVSPKLAQTIALESGIQTLVLNPVEGLTEADVEAKANYISLMRANLEQLRKAMACS